MENNKIKLDISEISISSTIGAEFSEFSEFIEGLSFTDPGDREVDQDNGPGLLG